MNRILERPILSLLVLSLICGFFFFLGSGKMALTDPDETFYAQTAEEMLLRREWVTPYLYNKPQFEKPILFYWLVEASYNIFGANEFAARLPSSILAFIGVIAMYLLGTLIFNRRAGFLSALILAVNVEYIILSRACVTDMTLFTFMLLGALFFFYGYLKGKNYFYLLSAVSLALATLTKGPIFPALFLGIVLIYFILAKDLGSIKKIPLLSGAVVFLAVALPWYVIAYKLHGSAFIDAFFGFHNVTRFVQSEHKIGSQFYYNIPIVLGGFFPWSVFLPAAIWRMFKKAQDADRLPQTEKRASIFILVWFFVIFAFLSVSSTKLPTYIFPCFMSLALIIGVFWDDFLRKDASAGLKKQMKWSYYFLTAVVLLGAAGASIYIAYDYPVITKGLIISCSFLVFGMILSLWSFLRKKYLRAFSMIIFSVAIFLLPFALLVLPDIERLETSKPIAMKLLTVMKPGDGLGSESNYLAGLAFYTGKTPVNTDKHDDLIKFMNSEGRIWCIMKEKNHVGLYDPSSHPEYVKTSYKIYGIGKRAIVTNELPEDGKYIIKRESVK